MTKKVNVLLAISIIVLIIVVVISIIVYPKGERKEEAQFGSVGITGEYRYTTNLATTNKAFLLKYGRGTLGSIVISTLGTGNVVLYDASSTIPNLRTIKATTSLPVIATIGASQAAGTYTYDVSFYNGLIAVFNGAQGTSTITYR